MLVLSLSYLDFMKIFKLRLYNWRLTTIPKTNRHYPDKNIVIIALGESSFRHIKEPTLLWLPKYTKIIKLLKDAKAKTIGFDVIIFKTPDEFMHYSLDRFLKRAETKGKEKADVKSILKLQIYFSCVSRSLSGLHSLYYSPVAQDLTWKKRRNYHFIGEFLYVCLLLKQT